QAAVRFQIAQLYMNEQKWKEAIAQLKQWFEVSPEPTPAAYYLMALAYYQLEDLASAVEPAEKAVSITESPPEPALQLLLAIHLTNHAYEKAEPVLLQLVQRYPKKIYWVQLSTLYGAQGDYDKALVFLELANTQGFLTDDADLRRIAQLMLAADLPYTAAEILEQGFAEKKLAEDANSFELLSTAWIQARSFDRALPPLKKAADLSKDGELYLRLAQVQLQREEFADAES